MDAKFVSATKPCLHKAKASLSRNNEIFTTSIHVALIYSLCRTCLSKNTRYLETLEKIKEEWIPFIEMEYVSKQVPRIDDMVERTIRILRIRGGLVPLCELTDEEMLIASRHITKACIEQQIKDLESAPTDSITGAIHVKAKAVKTLKDRLEKPSDHPEQFRPLIESVAEKQQ